MSKLWENARDGNDADIIDFIETHGARFADTANQFGRTLLIIAAESGRESTVRLLLKLGAELDKADNWGDTALYYSVYEKHMGIAGILLDAGADSEKAMLGFLRKEVVDRAAAEKLEQAIIDCLEKKKKQNVENACNAARDGIPGKIRQLPRLKVNPK